MTKPSILYLSRADVEQVDLSMAEVIEAVEEAFREKDRGRTIMPAKHWLAPSPRRFFSAMTSVVEGAGAAACKWQSGSADNAKFGLPYLTGLLLLNDTTTGLPVSVMDSTWVTAMRTAAATAVTARHLAVPSATTLAMLGCGTQGRRTVEALRIVRPAVRQVQAYDIDASALRRYVDEVTQRWHVEVRPCDSAREAVNGAQIVVTAGPIDPSLERTIWREWLEPGMLGVSVDYDCYWRPDAMQAADQFFTDDIAQLEHLREHGYFRDAPAITGEIAEVVVGKRKRARFDEVILAMNLGLSIEDVTTAKRVYEAAKTRGRGTHLEL